METLIRIFVFGFQSFWRNRLLTLGAVLLMTLTLTMVSVSVLITLLIRDSAMALRERVPLTIYFRNDEVTDQTILDFRQLLLKENLGIRQIDFTDKKKAFELFSQSKIIREDIRDAISPENNPLPRSLDIWPQSIDSLKDLADVIRSFDKAGIICADCLSIDFNRDFVDKFATITRIFQWLGWLFSLFFGLIAIFNVYNIIRLTIIARSDEIEIMRYVGASNAFIRGPFLVEGMLYGLIASAISLIFIVSISWLFTNQTSAAMEGIAQSFNLLGTNLFEYVLKNIPILISAQIGVGILLGLAVSAISLRRFLRA